MDRKGFCVLRTPPPGRLYFVLNPGHPAKHLRLGKPYGAYSRRYLKTVIKREAIPKTLSHPSCLEVPVLVCKPHIHTQVTETIFSECTLPMVASLLPLEEDLGGMDQEQYVDIHLKKKFEDKVRKQLTSWAVEYHISHNAFNALLKILRTELNLTYIPKDCRTLLKTETIQKMNIVTLNPGLYYHFGLKNGIIETLKRHASNFPDVTIDFSVNVDGLPVTKSSSSQFWPILGYVESIKESRPFPIGIFQGISKPQDVNEFLQPFVNEFNDLSERGMVVNNVTYSIKLTKFLCDAPAKAYVLNTKNHTGYNSCSKCHVEGDFLKNRMAFLELNSVVRNDEDVKKMLDENYHRGPSILSETNIGLVSNFPLDYMHLVCLGVTKKLLEFWTKGKQGVRLFKEDIESINNILESYRKCTVKEFSRLPRSLKELERWKATEFRQFLVYYGPSLLKPFLKDPMWSHFLSLHVAIRILISEELCRVSEYVNYAEKLLQYFVRKYGEIYGDEYINHNVHNLLHLCNDARKFGCLDNFSCFIFENYMWEIKKTLKTSKYPLQQFINRYYEFTTYCTNNSQDIDDEMLVKEVGYENIEGSFVNTFAEYKCKKFRLIISEPDCFAILKNGDFVKALRFFHKNDEFFFQCHTFATKKNFFVTPCNSLKFNCATVANLSDDVGTFSVKSILSKAAKYNNVILPLIHSN